MTTVLALEKPIEKEEEKSICFLCKKTIDYSKTVLCQICGISVCKSCYSVDVAPRQCCKIKYSIMVHDQAIIYIPREKTDLSEKEIKILEKLKETKAIEEEIDVIDSYYGFLMRWECAEFLEEKFLFSEDREEYALFDYMENEYDLIQSEAVAYENKLRAYDRKW